MMIYAGSELIGFLFKAFAVVVFAGIIILPLVSVKIKSLISILSVLMISVLTSVLAINGFANGGIEYIADGGPFFGQIPLRIDPLSGWFILIINFTSVSGILYGAGYLKSSSTEAPFLSFHWILFLLFQSSMLLVCMVQHSMAFLVSWEVMSLSSFMLVLYDSSNPRVLKAGVNYLVQMHISVVFLTVAFLWVYFQTGTFDFKGINTFFSLKSNIWLFLIFLLDSA